jgi:hypothetical protein
MAVEKPLFKHRRHLGNLSVNSFANRIIELKVLEEFFQQHLNRNGYGVISRRDETARPGRLSGGTMCNQRRGQR